MLILLSKKIMATGDMCILVADLHCCMAETSEYWQRTPGTQKGSPFSSKGGRTKYKTKRETRVRDGDLSWGGSRKGGDVSTQQETLSQAGLWGVLESQKAT